jgi:acyl-coenzyme A synthetase/AMP-(fatty) acid ligase
MFKRLLIAAALLSTVPLMSACATLGTVGSALSTPVCANALADDKARWGAEALYNVPASAYRSANEHHLFDGHDALKANIKGKLQTLAKYLLVVRDAHQHCNHDTLLQYKSAMDQLSTEVTALIPR